MATPRRTPPEPRERVRYRRRRPWAVVGAALRDFDARFPRAARLAADPVHLAHAYPEAEDREVAALLASCLAFGRASSLVAKARQALDALGPHPAEALRGLRAGEAPPGLSRWVHRWVRARDLAWLLGATGHVLRAHGTLGRSLRAQLRRDDDPRHLLEPMRRFALLFREPDPRPWLGRSSLTRGAGGLLPVPDGQAAAKRLCLFLRWMVRPEDGVDLGLWEDVGARRLTVPLDTHVARIGAYVGLTERRTPGWLMAREITESLARFEPEDPTRLDFALSHLGIMGGCPRRRNLRTCAACDLLPACRL